MSSEKEFHDSMVSASLLIKAEQALLESDKKIKELKMKVERLEKLAAHCLDVLADYGIKI